MNETKNITPIQQRGDYWFKREGLYKPYDFSTASGCKLRLCQLLIENLKNITYHFAISKNILIFATRK